MQHRDQNEDSRPQRGLERRWKRTAFLLLLNTLCGCALVSCMALDRFRAPQGDAFGIRHDRELHAYEEIAAKQHPERPDFSPVLCLEYSLKAHKRPEFIATGVLISDRWVLTAGHNVYDASEQRRVADAEGIYVLLGNDPNRPQAEIRVVEVHVHPSWAKGHQELKHANDLCLLKLAQPIKQLRPASLHRAGEERIGSVIWHAGFGDYSEREGQDPDALSRKHAGQNILDRVQSDLISPYGKRYYPGGLLAIDFDSPTGMKNSLGDRLIYEEEKILGRGQSEALPLDLESTSVEGDSGGPLFVLHKGNWEVAGILSAGLTEPLLGHIDGDYGDISVYIRVADSLDWIDSVMNKAP